MNFLPIIVNFIAIMVGLVIYLIVMNSKWGKEHEDIQYFVMLCAIIAAVLVGGLLRWLIM